MPNPTRQEIMNAHDALEDLNRAALKTAEFCGDTDRFLIEAKDILKVLPPKPRPTMAEVEWDDELHYLAEAEHPTWGKVIMLSASRLNKTIFMLASSGYSNYVKTVNSGELTPTGKRYTLTETTND